MVQNTPQRVPPDWWGNRYSSSISYLACLRDAAGGACFLELLAHFVSAKNKPSGGESQGCLRLVWALEVQGTWVGHCQCLLWWANGTCLVNHSAPSVWQCWPWGSTMAEQGLSESPLGLVYHGSWRVRLWIWSCQHVLFLIQGERERIKLSKDRGAKWGWGGCVPWWKWVLSLVSGALVLSILHTSWINQCIPFMMIWVRVGFLGMKSGALTDSYGRVGGWSEREVGLRERLPWALELSLLISCQCLRFKMREGRWVYGGNL